MYGPMPNIMWRKWWSWHFISSGVVILGFRDDSILDIAAWNSCFLKCWNWGSSTYFFAAVKDQISPKCSSSTIHYYEHTFGYCKESKEFNSTAMGMANIIVNVANGYVHGTVVILTCGYRHCCLVTPENDRYKCWAMCRWVLRYLVLFHGLNVSMRWAVDLNVEIILPVPTPNPPTWSSHNDTSHSPDKSPCEEHSQIHH